MSAKHLAFLCCTSVCPTMLVLLLQLLLSHAAVGDQVEISLNGVWSLSDADGRVKAIEAQVPGTVHLDLM